LGGGALRSVFACLFPSASFPSSFAWTVLLSLLLLKCSGYLLMVISLFPPSLPFSIRLFRFNSLLVLMMIQIKISVNAFALTGRWGGGREGGKVGSGQSVVGVALVA